MKPKLQTSNFKPQSSKPRGAPRSIADSRSGTKGAPHALRFTLSLLCALFLSACLSSGVTDLNTARHRVAIFNQTDLYVMSRDDQDIAFYGFRPDTRFAPVIAPDGAAVFYVDLGHRLIRQPLDGTPGQTLFTRVGQPGPGAMTFLPGGQLFLFDTGFNDDHYARVVDPATNQTTLYLTGISQIFFSANAIQMKTAAPFAPQPYAVARLEAGELPTFNFVFLSGTCLIEDRRCFYAYSADAAGVHELGQAARAYDADTQLLFSRRVDDDITSGVLTADGRYLILRVRSLISPGLAQSIYLFDLTTNDPPAPLVQDAAPRPEYAVSPDGALIAYEELVGGVPHVKLYTLATGERVDLGAGTLDPQWWK